jgi:hypothetical protein
MHALASATLMALFFIGLDARRYRSIGKVPRMDDPGAHDPRHHRWGTGVGAATLILAAVLRKD